MSPHRRAFLIDPHGPAPTIRVEASSPIGAARVAFRRLGPKWPITVLDRELGQTSDWWIPKRGGNPATLHRCECGAPVRPTGRAGRPFETCAACREEVA